MARAAQLPAVINRVGAKSLRATVSSWRIDDADARVQLELERVEAEGQSLSDGFQGCFLERPELEEGSHAGPLAGAFNGLCLGS